MIIESGSQNASRIQGQYAYPVRRYNTSAVEGVSAVRGRNFRVQKSGNESAPTSEKLSREKASESISSELKLYGPITQKNSSARNNMFSSGKHVNLLV